MFVWSNFHFRVLNHWLNIFVASINLYQDLYPMLSEQLMRLWEMQIGCLQRLRRKKERYHFLLWKHKPLSIWARFYRLFWLKCFRSISTGIINLFHHMLLIYFIIRYTIKKNIVEKHMLASIFDFLQHKIWDCIILSCPELLCMAWFDDSCKNSSYG